jgi:hypothetical protein
MYCLFQKRIILFQIKPIMPGQYTAQLMSTQFESTSDPQVGSTDTNHTPARRNSLKLLEAEPASQCDKCCIDGTNTNLVRCDECRKCFHFHCLEPPLKKTPKKRGYSWHCADCDPTVYSILVILLVENESNLWFSASYCRIWKIDMKPSLPS